MNGFLVVVRMTMDDLPLRFFETLKEARKYIKTHVVDDEPTAEMRLDIDKAAVSIDAAETDVVGVDVLRIVNGWPVAKTVSVTFA